MTADQPSFTCPACGATSYHPADVAHGYCGRCHDFTGSSVVMRRLTCDDHVYLTETGECVGRSDGADPVGASCSDCPARLRQEASS